MARISKKIVSGEKEKPAPENRPTGEKPGKTSDGPFVSPDILSEKPAFESLIANQEIVGSCLANVRKLFDSKDRERKELIPVIEQILREIALQTRSNSIVRGFTVALLIGDFGKPISVSGDTTFVRNNGGRGQKSGNGVTAAYEYVAALSQSSAETVADDYSRVRRLLVEPLKERIDNNCSEQETADFFETRIELLLKSKPELLKTAIAHDSPEEAMEILEPKIIGEDRPLNFRNADFKEILINKGARNADFEARKVKENSTSQEQSWAETPSVQPEFDTTEESVNGREFEIYCLLTETEFKRLNQIAEVKNLSHDEAVGLTIINFNL